MLPRVEYVAERYLAHLYVISGVSSLLTTICMSIIWLHWRVVLNTCAGGFQSYYSYYDEKDCGCFLWGKDTQTYFVGSNIGYCIWAWVGPLIPLFVCLCYGWYHVYRVCCRTVRPSDRRGKMEVRQRSTEILQLTVEQEMVEDEISPYFWTPAIIISAIMLIYTLVHAIMITHGLISTCDQYRGQIIKNVHATGPFVIVIQNRLSCGAVFDFMDYLHQDLSFERRRDYRINTAIPAYLTIIACWTSVLSWVGIMMVAISRFNQSRRVRM